MASYLKLQHDVVMCVAKTEEAVNKLIADYNLLLEQYRDLSDECTHLRVQCAGYRDQLLELGEDVR